MLGEWRSLSYSQHHIKTLKDFSRLLIIHNLGYELVFLIFLFPISWCSDCGSLLFYEFTSTFNLVPPLIPAPRRWLSFCLASHLVSLWLYCLQFTWIITSLGFPLPFISVPTRNIRSTLMTLSSHHWLSTRTVSSGFLFLNIFEVLSISPFPFLLFQFQNLITYHVDYGNSF